jgi:hypothetical protein
MKPQVLRLSIGLVAVIAISFAFSGCDLFSKADNITIEQEFKVKKTVDLTTETTNSPLAISDTINLADNAEVAKYAEKIQEISVLSIKYHIEEYTQPDNTEVFFKNGQASIYSIDGGANPITSASFEGGANGVNLKQTTSDKDLAFDSNGLSKVASEFKSKKAIIFNATGALSETPVKFKLISTIKVKITAKAL